MSVNSYTMIVLHGFTMESEDMEYLTNKINKIFPKGIVINYIYLQAPKRKISTYDGEEEYAWFDYFTDKTETEEFHISEEEISQDNLIESRKSIHDILDNEIMKIGDPTKIFLLGYSQGCCQVLDAGLTYPKKIGGIIGFKGHILGYTTLETIYKQSVWVTHGTKDDALSYEIAKTSYDNHKLVNDDITFVTLENKNHDLNSGINHAIKELSKWLLKKI